ncbi:hypothetical protein HanRHA438_Chr17g0799821 [Helianthus annuus]|nr:hypothetical protein HanRHA438_Chr17g0799821 [Helianthus annuus]
MLNLSSTVTCLNLLCFQLIRYTQSLVFVIALILIFITIYFTLILIIIYTPIFIRFMPIHIRLRFMLTHIFTLHVHFMLILILTCLFILKLILMLVLSFIHMIHTFVPIRERNPRDSLAWVPYILKLGLAYILHSYNVHILILFMYTLIHTQLVQAMQIMRRSK